MVHWEQGLDEDCKRVRMTQRDLDPKSREPRDLLIEMQGRRQTVVAINIGLTVLYWRVGKHVHLEVAERSA
jgi:hypothetical protein